MHNKPESIRREILGDVAADLIDEAARRRMSEVEPGVLDDFEEFLDEADDQQMMLLNLAQMFMEISIAKNEKRLAYAACALLALSGALDNMIDDGDWAKVMRYAEYAWDEANKMISGVIVDQLKKFTEE